MTTKTTDNLSSITPEELKKRREAVDAAISSHALEGITLHPKTLEILEEYARGEISLEEFNTLMDNAIL
ncbi:antitoxin VbhA family protein [Bartonella raoultii]|uniref:Antitoxin VbhA family protein n=1 Tax=Bartonella raoultii TaxID=1457020 RepID=A0ABS7I4M5_9HYPH|nr:antitoxin VbhA family protein [Bartonella raoultii]